MNNKRISALLTDCDYRILCDETLLEMYMYILNHWNRAKPLPNRNSPRAIASAHALREQTALRVINDKRGCSLFSPKIPSKNAKTIVDREKSDLLSTFNAFLCPTILCNENAELFFSNVTLRSKKNIIKY